METNCIKDCLHEELNLTGMQTALLLADAAFFTALGGTCVNRADPMSFFFLVGYVRVSDYNFIIGNSVLKLLNK